MLYTFLILPSLQPTREQYTLARQITRATEHGDDIGTLLRGAQAADGDIPDIAGGALEELGVGDHAGVADHGGRDVVDRDAVLGQLARQVAHHARQACLARRVVAAIDTPAVARDAGHEDDAAPSLRGHVWHGQLGQHKRRP